MTPEMGNSQQANWSAAGATQGAKQPGTNGATVEQSLSQQPKPKWTRRHTLWLLLIVGIVGALGLAGSKVPELRPPNFVVTMALMVVSMGIIAHGIVGNPYGSLIDERNKMSLSRLQMILWTIVVLSGFLTAASSYDNSKVAIPQEIWALMGISAASMVGAQAVRSTQTGPLVKADQVTNPTGQVEMLKEELDRQNLPPHKVAFTGKIVIWRWLDDARLADLFQGDQIANAARLDLGKLQLFFFTVVLVFVYAVRLYLMLGDSQTKGVFNFPPVDQSMVALLGISHAGFLTNQAIPR
jgi:hypothetical protein